MPVLPVIDLMILVAWTSLIVAAAQKVIGLALATRPQILGMGPFDFVVVAAVCLLFALSLAARVWVRRSEAGALVPPHEGRDGNGREVLPDFPDPRTAAGRETGPRAEAAQTAGASAGEGARARTERVRDRG
jgi:hypothetical protein